MKRRDLIRAAIATAVVAPLAPLLPAKLATGGSVPVGTLAWWPVGCELPRAWAPVKYVGLITMSDGLALELVEFSRAIDEMATRVTTASGLMREGEAM